VSIYSTTPTYPVFATDWYGLKPDYDYASGTSMAAPVVAGEAALILSHYPDLTADQVAEAIRNTADDLGVPGFDPYYGWGRVNAATALKMDTVGPVAVSKWRVDDTARAGIQGNGDGVINPGESVGLYLTLKNRGGQNAGAVTVAVTTADAYVTIGGAGATALASIPRWGAAEGATPIALAISPAAPVGHAIAFHAVIGEEHGGSWEGDFEISVGLYGPALRVASFVIDDDMEQQSQGNSDGLVQLGEQTELRVTLRNDGDAGASGVQAVITTQDPYVVISDESELYPGIPAGGSASCDADFDLSVIAGCPDGHVARLNLQITDDAGHVWTDFVEFPVYVPAPEVRYSWSRVAADSGSGGIAGDGGVSPGETAELEVTLANLSLGPASGVQASISSADPQIHVTSSAD